MIRSNVTGPPYVPVKLSRPTPLATPRICRGASGTVSALPRACRL